MHPQCVVRHGICRGATAFASPAALARVCSSLRRRSSSACRSSFLVKGVFNSTRKATNPIAVKPAATYQWACTVEGKKGVRMWYACKSSLRLATGDAHAQTYMGLPLCGRGWTKGDGKVEEEEHKAWCKEAHGEDGGALLGEEGVEGKDRTIW